MSLEINNYTHQLYTSMWHHHCSHKWSIFHTSIQCRGLECENKLVHAHLNIISNSLHIRTTLAAKGQLHRLVCRMVMKEILSERRQGHVWRSIIPMRQCSRLSLDHNNTGEMMHMVYLSRKYWMTINKPCCWQDTPQLKSLPLPFMIGWEDQIVQTCFSEWLSPLSVSQNETSISEGGFVRLKGTHVAEGFSGSSQSIIEIIGT